MASTASQNISILQCPLHVDPRNISDLSPLVIPTWISLVTINIITSPLTVFINFLVIWAVLENEQLRSNNYNVLVIVLSLADLLVGLVVQPLYVALKVCLLAQCFRLCELAMAYSVSGILCSAWTVVTMVIISLERYLFIEHPLYYQRSVTSKKLMIATAAGWVLVGTTILSTWLQVHESVWERQLPVILTFGPSCVVILFCVAKINLTARRQMKAIATMHQEHLAQQSKIKEYKRTFILGLVVLASVASLCPVLVFKIVGAVKGDWSDGIKYLHGATTTVLHLQSIINPIIYSLRLSDIRAGVAKRLSWNQQ